MDTSRYHRKFLVIRTKDLTVVEENTFTLVPSRDPWAKPALLAYASACEAEAPELAADLRRLSRLAGE